MNIYQRIKQDHEKHRTLLDEIEQTSGDSEVRHTLFSELKKEVTAHANAEEQSFYAELMEKNESQEQTRHSVHEHEQVDDLFGELEKTDMSSAGWLITFKKLKHDLEHHMDEEEKDVFALAKKLISEAQAKQMVNKFDRRKSQEKEEAA